MDEATALAHAIAEFGLSDVEFIARGGQKAVYGASQAGVSVVVKVVLLTNRYDPNALERCSREVDLLGSLTSPNIVRAVSDLKELGSSVEAVAWLEERLDGSDLGSIGGPRPWAEVKAMLEGVAAGLNELHSNGHVHRDLSPGNVRLTLGGVWKVMDPGLAKHFDRTSITGLWQPGTPGFMSPEHAVMGGRVSPASDVFCLGLLAHVMLTGSTPTPFLGDADTYRQQLLGTQLPSIVTSRPDLDPGAIEIIDICLQRQPARRYLNAGEVLAALRELT